jgi:hypothetical protein
MSLQSAEPLRRGATRTALAWEFASIGSLGVGLLGVSSVSIDHLVHGWGLAYPLVVGVALVVIGVVGLVRSLRMSLSVGEDAVTAKGLLGLRVVPLDEIAESKLATMLLGRVVCLRLTDRSAVFVHAVSVSRGERGGPAEEVAAEITRLANTRRGGPDPWSADPLPDVVLSPWNPSDLPADVTAVNLGRLEYGRHTIRASAVENLMAFVIVMVVDVAWQLALPKSLFPWLIVIFGGISLVACFAPLLIARQALSRLAVLAGPGVVGDLTRRRCRVMHLEELAGVGCTDLAWQAGVFGRTEIVRGIVLVDRTGRRIDIPESALTVTVGEIRNYITSDVRVTPGAQQILDTA